MNVLFRRSLSRHSIALTRGGDEYTRPQDRTGDQPRAARAVFRVSDQGPITRTIATSSRRVRVIGANQWLADTFTWRVDRHRHAPSWMKQAVLTMTMIRSVVDECSAMSMIPNELLFEIFSHLEAPELEMPLDDQHQSETATITSSSCDRSRKTKSKQKNKKCTMM